MTLLNLTYDIGMNEGMSKEVKQKVQAEILEVLRKHNLPTNEIIKDYACAFIKVISCQQQTTQG